MKTIRRNAYAHKGILSCSLLLSSWMCVIAPTFAKDEILLLGKWQLSDNSVTVNIAKCNDTADLCATIINEVLQPGETSALGSVVVKEIRSDAKGGWRGKFLDGKDEINAVIKAKSKDVVEFKGCALLIFCETQIYKRVN
jgi:uncharacterized protein (DUF2147 family)